MIGCILSISGKTPDRDVGFFCWMTTTDFLCNSFPGKFACFKKQETAGITLLFINRTIQELKDQGCSDEEIFEAISVTSLFNFLL